MKIGFVLDDSLDSSDGVQQYVLTLGKWFTGQGHEVHYLVGQTKRSDIPNIHSLSRNVAVRFNGNRMSMPLPASSEKIKKLLKREKFDVLHIQMPYSPFLGAKVLKLAPAKTRLVGTFHILPFGRLQRISSRLLCWWLRSSLKLLDQTLSVSEPAQQFASMLGIHSEVLPNVVDPSHFNGVPMLEYKKNFTIVFLGRLVERKGCRELLQAVKLLKIPNLKVVICGTGADYNDLLRWVEQHKLRDVVEFKGYISEHEKANYLASADVAVFPSLGGESFGIVLIEAMSAKAGVVIGGNNPGYSSVLAPLPETLFDPRNAHQTAKLITKLHDDPVLARKLHAEQQQLVQQYDVAVVGQKLLSYYQHVNRD